MRFGATGSPSSPTSAPGLPSAGPAHEVAARSQPDSRVTYVDNEPVAVAHSRLLPQDNPTRRHCTPTCVTSTLSSPPTLNLLDFDLPIAARPAT